MIPSWKKVTATNLMQLQLEGQVTFRVVVSYTVNSCMLACGCYRKKGIKMRLCQHIIQKKVFFD